MTTSAELKPEEKMAGWLNYLSVTTVLIALCTTLSTYKGGNYSSQALLSEIKANDQWALYQSKSIKSYLYEIQLENLKSDLSSAGGDKADTMKKRIRSYEQHVIKYKEDREQISREAKKLEADRDVSSNHSNAFGLAVVFLEISILLASIAALLKKKMLWYISMLPGMIGLLYFTNGFLLLIP